MKPGCFYVLRDDLCLLWKDWDNDFQEWFYSFVSTNARSWATPFATKEEAQQAIIDVTNTIKADGLLTVVQFNN